MITRRGMNTRAWLLAAAGVVAFLGSAAPVMAGPGPMQVEEPELKGPKPPIQPEKDQASWKDKKSASLTPAQKQALQVRQETMKDMVALIKQKRRALKDARPEDREALALELHNLILEKSQIANSGRSRAERKETKAANKQSSGETDADKNARVRDASGNRSSRAQEQQEERLRLQEQRRKALEERLKQIEKSVPGNNGNGNGHTK